MSPEIYKQSKNVFLIFPPGCGGNHIANMLSLHPDFEPRFISETYTNDIIRMYKKKFQEKILPGKYKGDCAVHFSDLENLQPTIFEENIDYIAQTDKKYIFCAHFEEYFVSLPDLHKMALLKDRIYILFSKPSRNNMLAYLRVNTGPWKLGEPKTINYTIDGFCSGNRIDKEKVLLVNTDKFYTMDGFGYLQELFFTNFGIEIPDLFWELHQLYMSDKVRIYGSMMP